MIDWFASKIGMLVFVAVVLSVLLGFVGMQMDVFAFEQNTRMAEDISRLIDVASSGGSVTYEPPLEEYELMVDSSSKTVTVNGVARYFLADVYDAELSDAEILTIENVEGVVNVSA